MANFLQLKFPSGSGLPITFHMRIIYGLFRKYYGGWYPVRDLCSEDVWHLLVVNTSKWTAQYLGLLHD